MVYPNKTPNKITELEISLEEDKTAKLTELVEELFVMRGMENKVYECIGPYNDDGVKRYSVNVNSFPINPVREGVILEKIDWERNNL